MSVQEIVADLISRLKRAEAPKAPKLEPSTGYEGWQVHSAPPKQVRRVNTRVNSPLAVPYNEPQYAPVLPRSFAEQGVPPGFTAEMAETAKVQPVAAPDYAVVGQKPTTQLVPPKVERSNRYLAICASNGVEPTDCSHFPIVARRPA